MNAIQTVGLSLSLVAMIANFYEKVIHFCSWDSLSFLLSIIEFILISISFCLVISELLDFQDFAWLDAILLDVC